MGGFISKVMLDELAFLFSSPWLVPVLATVRAALSAELFAPSGRPLFLGRARDPEPFARAMTPGLGMWCRLRCWSPSPFCSGCCQC
jgi:multicomponent K+:H+ antiporter subunit A